VDAKQVSVASDCKCGLDGFSAFCGNILGTAEYADALSSMKALLEKS